VLSFSCTDLEEELRDSVNREAATSDIQPGELLSAAYEGLRQPYMDQSRWWAAQEHTGDLALGPTRGPDWDDNGVWRVLHNHTWAPDHSFMTSTFGELLQVVYATTNLLTFSPSAQQAAEARFLRAFVVLTVVDGWGQVPFRDAGTSLLENAQVLSASEAVDLVISEANAIIGDLPDGPANVANKDAARVLLMKSYLNKGAYLNRESPAFDNGDIQQVITLADEIINSGKYSLADNFYDNFAPNNDQISTENIWTGENRGGVSAGNVAFQWNCTLHYNQNPSGWNGFTTLGDFYDSFEENDTRRGMEYDGVTDVSGIRTGLLLGQQYDENGTALEDRKGNPLAFTKEVALIENGNNLEVTGIRVIKYPIDYVTPGGPSDNDYVFYRYADVLLMKAEAALRTGDNGTALDIVNDIREVRGASTLSSIDLDELLAERGREFYWEGMRRTDLIRFGKFLDAWENKPASGSERLLFPIPAQSLAANPNLTQNPGY
jgi:hypothetical protein